MLPMSSSSLSPEVHSLVPLTRARPVVCVCDVSNVHARWDVELELKMKDEALDLDS